MNLSRTLLCLCALLVATTAGADQNDPRLEDLFERLQSATSVAEAAPIEELIWQVWFEHDDGGIASRMAIGVVIWFVTVSIIKSMGVEPAEPAMEHIGGEGPRN